MLAARIESLLFSRAFAHDEMRMVLDAIEPLGPVAVFGGMLRDLSLASAARFASDIDLVISTEADDDLAVRLRGLADERNRYGGYRVKRGRWMIDVWPLRDTWAFREGLVTPPSFQGLVRTTFFNWDAIVYEIGSGALHHIPEYFQILRTRLLEINLEPNANPTGNIARALRAVLYRRARLGPQLAQYTANALGHGELAEMSSMYAAFVQDPHVRTVVEQLKDHVRREPGEIFEFYR